MLTFELTLLLFSLIAGLLGSILGLGGGVIVIPTLTLLLGVNIKYAIGASILSVIATSSGAAAAYVKDRITNVRIGIFLEVATTLGAISGAIIGSYSKPQVLFIVFGLSLILSAYLMSRKKSEIAVEAAIPHPLATKLRLNSSYPDRLLGKEIHYSVLRVPFSFVVMLLAGLLSGLLGIGSGILKVLAMDAGMGLPIKVSSATSNFMMGVTAAASAGAYFMKGDIAPTIAAPVCLGVLIGARTGAKLLHRLPSAQIRKAFIAVLLFTAVQMIWKGFHTG